MIAPVQVLVVGLDQSSFSGEVLAELDRLGSAGIVRLVGLLVVERHPDGQFETIAPEGVRASLADVVRTVLARQAESLDEPTGETDGAWSLEDVIPPGRTAAVAFIEHLWAAPLRTAIMRAGGVPLEETWLAPDDLAQLESVVQSA